jgi:hypothetical protein
MVAGASAFDRWGKAKLNARAVKLLQEFQLNGAQLDR